MKDRYVLLEWLIHNREDFYDFITVYCPNDFELGKNFQDQVKLIFDGNLLIKLFDCTVITDKAKNCAVQQNCKEFIYNMKEGNTGYPTCVKKMYYK